MRTTAVYRHSFFLAHSTGREHPECPARLAAIYRDLLGEETVSGLQFPFYSCAGKKALHLVHSPHMVNRVASTAQKKAVYLERDTRTSASSYQAACLAAGAVIDGIQSLYEGRYDNVFCLVRPPGHHAEHNRSMGFCLFNNVAIGAQWAVSEGGVRKIFIFDWDLHHGNGTQKSFYATDHIFYCSIHQFPHYPGSGRLEEGGRGKGEGHTLNIPLPGGQGDMEYAAIINRCVLPLVRAYQPELLMVSCGFDIDRRDPLGAMQVTPAGFAYMTRKMVELAEEVCEGRLLFTLEGGYDLDAMREGVTAVLTELSGGPLLPSLPTALSLDEAQRLESATPYVPMLDAALGVAGRYWVM